MPRSRTNLCRELAETLSACVDGEATPAERDRLELHLRGCATCRDRRSRLAELRRRTLVASAPPLDDLVGRIAVPVGRARPPRRRIHWAAAAVVALGLSVGGVLAATRTTPSESAPERAARVVTVKIMDQQPSLRHVTIHRGDMVRWVNTDLEHHELTIDSSGARIDGALPRRGVQTVTYTTPGTYQFDCALHPQLSGTVTVL